MTKREITRHVPFRCPKCGEPMVRVVDTREWQGTVRRRRACPNGHVAETRERMWPDDSRKIA